MYVYIYVGDSYAASMHCSCLNFITSGFIGELLAKLDMVFYEKYHILSI